MQGDTGYASRLVAPARLFLHVEIKIINQPNDLPRSTSPPALCLRGCFSPQEHAPKTGTGDPGVPEPVHQRRDCVTASTGSTSWVQQLCSAFNEQRRRWGSIMLDRWRLYLEITFESIYSSAVMEIVISDRRSNCISVEIFPRLLHGGASRRSSRFDTATRFFEHAFLASSFRVCNTEVGVSFEFHGSRCLPVVSFDHSRRQIFTSIYLARYSNKVSLVQPQRATSNDVSIRFPRTNMDTPVKSPMVGGDRNGTGSRNTWLYN